MLFIYTFYLAVSLLVEESSKQLGGVSDPRQAIGSQNVRKSDRYTEPDFHYSRTSQTSVSTLYPSLSLAISSLTVNSPPPLVPPLFLYSFVLSVNSSGSTSFGQVRLFSILIHQILNVNIKYQISNIKYQISNIKF